MKTISKVVRDQTGVGRSVSFTRTFSLATAAFSVAFPQAAGRIESTNTTSLELQILPCVITTSQSWKQHLRSLYTERLILARQPEPGRG